MRAGVSSVAMIESGARPNPRMATLSKIAKALNVDISELMHNGDFVAAPGELVKLLQSDMAGDITESEVDELRRWQPTGRRPTAHAYYLYLQAIRATRAPSD